MARRGRFLSLTAECFGGAAAVMLLLLAAEMVTGAMADYATADQAVMLLVTLCCAAGYPLLVLGAALARRGSVKETAARLAKPFGRGALLGAATLAAALVMLLLSEYGYGVFKPTCC